MMKKNKSIINTVAVALCAIVLTSCGGSNSSTNKDAISAFIGENDNIILFGSTDLKGILAKSDYANVPKLGKLLSSEMSTLEKVIDFSKPMYYAVEGPMDNDGNPSATYAFITLVDKDKFLAEMTQRGFDVNEKGDLSFSEDGDFAIGVKGKLAIVVVQSKDFELETLMVETFEKAEGGLVGGKADDILDQTGDFVLGMNVASLYNTSDTDLEKLEDEKKESIKELVKDSYIQTIVKFEDGAAIIETKNFFSDKLKSKMFFKSDSNAPIIGKLGKGPARFGFSLNLDMVKMQALVDEYSPEALEELASSLGTTAQIALMATGTDMSKIFSGQLGVVMLGDLGANGSMVPDFNVFLGLNSKGRELGEMAVDMISDVDEARVDLGGLTIYSSAKNASEKGGLIIPKGCENFGKGGANVFLNLEGVNFDDLDLEGEANVIRVIRYITFEYNNEGGRIYIKAKDGKENILKQSIKVMVKELESEIDNMAI